MKFTKLLTAGAVLASLAAVTACTGNEDDNKTTQSTVKLSVHYVNSGYHFAPSYQGDAAATGIGGETLSKGTLLPAWQEFAKDLNIKIEDGTDTSAKDAKTEWQNFLDSGFNGVDIAMVDGTNSITAANTNKLKSINELIEKGLLPNFAKWLETEGGGLDGAMWNSMKSADGNVYYLPYFDGLNGLEKVWLMEQSYIKKILDSEETNGMDTTAAKTSSFEAQVPKFNQDVEISVNGQKQTIKVQYEQSIVDIQNKLATKNGKTYAEALRTYIDEVYGDYIGQGKTYSKRSEIFTSEAACYNADELIALMRCMVNNPHYLTGTDTLYAFVPRSGEGNRIKQMMEFTSIWGQRGVSAESSRLYFNKAGELQDARTKEEIYNNLDKMHELYNEGFFPGNFYTGADGTAKNEWRKKYMQTGQVFALYDYDTTSTAYNNDANSSYKSLLIPMISPIAKWDDQDDSTPEYFHFSEDNRALKSGGWAIMADTDALEATCKLADYMWTDKGADVQDYGPNNTSYRAAVTQYDEQGKRLKGEGTMTLKGKEVVKLSDKVFNYTNGSDSFKANWNNFCRKYIGSTQGIGHQRSDGIGYQATISKACQAGTEKLLSAVASGVYRMCTTASVSNKFYASVPTSFALSASDQTNIQNSVECTTMQNFWLDDSSANGKVVYAYWICNGKDDKNVTSIITSYESLKNSFSKVDAIFLNAYRRAYISQN